MRRISLWVSEIRKEALAEAVKKQYVVVDASELLLAERMAFSKKFKRKIENLQYEMDRDGPTQGDS